MKVKVFLIFLTMGIANSISAEGLLHSRELVHKGFSSQEKLESAIKVLIKRTDNLSKAYLGLCETMMAEHVFWPGSKLAYFKKGKAKIEAACKKDTTQVELRYIRLLVQFNAPSFLGYSDEIKGDFSYFKSNIEPSAISQTWKLKFIEILSNSENISKSQKNELDLIEKRLNK